MYGQSVDTSQIEIESDKMTGLVQLRVVADKNLSEQAYQHIIAECISQKRYTLQSILCANDWVHYNMKVNVFVCTLCYHIIIITQLHRLSKIKGV